MDGFNKHALESGRDPPSPNLSLSLCIYLIEIIENWYVAIITIEHVYEIFKVNKNMWFIKRGLETERRERSEKKL